MNAQTSRQVPNDYSPQMRGHRPSTVTQSANAVRTNAQKGARQRVRGFTGRSGGQRPERSGIVLYIGQVKQPRAQMSEGGR